MKFSEVLEEYLEHRETEPDEPDGYTDKEWHRQRRILLARLDSFFEERKP